MAIGVRKFEAISSRFTRGGCRGHRRYRRSVLRSIA